MKKYKLIKKFPNLPSRWDIGMIVEPASDPIYFKAVDNVKYGISWVYEGFVFGWSEFWEEVKEPLFITEDGVEMFEKDEYWFVDTNYSLDIFYNTVVSGGNYTYDNKRFSTREKAQEYLDNDRPIFSKQQILDAIEKSTSTTLYIFSSEEQPALINPLDKDKLKKELGL